ncbi:MAG: GntR family transcriptional regulator [Mesorhizobium sp.]|uniref:GntR family transcriptional regulator n=1 Tax=Mesorhizobium sp. TaxID=1871066 RepID=UPI001227CAC6|nr:GntR family transcriptional regulator [Mesorhizobium sp.]TIT25026.1 MAG: GntR family transcriptional regulator [Mesorhizobium sp.]TIX42583.1 MAG: GntR family transcriptional regulator [Mesorhizobium sp.]
MRTDTVYKKAFNRAANMLRDGQLAGELPSENELRRRMCVSRTTVRKVLRELVHRELVTECNGHRSTGRPVGDNDYYPDAETTPRAKHVEQQFMEWMLRGDTRPGTSINELELARQFGVATNGIREFLIRFSRFGLIEKRPNTGWLFKGFTEDFALELFEIRVMFELRSAQLFSLQPDSSPLWSKLAALKMAHTDLLERIEGRFHDFSGLDNRFHRLINEASQNRFIDDFYDIITFIFHYHYQWNKHDEKQRNLAAIHEHIAYIGALESRNSTRIEVACRAHLASARETLMRSLTAFDESSINA